MNFRQHRRQEHDINLTPLIDVVFLLLIFFMVSTTFKKEAEITIDLPEASAEPAEVVAEILEIAIDADGNYYVNRQRVINTQLDTLMQAVTKVAGEMENPELVISADAKTPHQAVVTAMDAARRLGLVHMSIATKELVGSSQ